MASRRNALRRKDSGDSGKQSPESPWKESWIDELFAVVCFAGAVFLLASFLSQLSHCEWVIGPEHCQPGNIMGPWGQKVGAVLSLYLGWYFHACLARCSSVSLSEESSGGPWRFH